ncbi:hypothetical protein QJQ45_006541 [Haematococcus lacustris]|nr:hypothetical protein QJQ45_006541 [Haematococcus lacustris]
MAADVVLRKALASKFANDWLFRYNSDGIVVCQCKRCPPNNRAELGVANMSQLAARHKCKLEGAPSISRKRSPEPSFGPLPREDRGAAMPEGIQRAVRRRIGLFLVTQQLPFNIMDNVHLQSVFQLLGVDVYKEKHYRTQLLDELYSEVKQATFKELRKLAKPSPAQPSPAQPSPAQPSPAQPSPAQPSPAQPSPAQPSPAQPSPAQREMPTIVILGCSAHQMNLLCKDLSKPNVFMSIVVATMYCVLSRFAGLLLMAEDVEKLMPAIHGMVHGDNWPQLRLLSANAAVFEKCVTTPWYKSLKLVIKLMKPISNAIHRLEADAPYLSQVVAAFQRRAQTHYSPAYAAAYALDPANYKCLAPGTHPRPTMHRLQPTQQEDVVTVVAQLAECSLGAARRELTLLTLGDWPTDMKSSVEAIVAETRTDEDGKTTTACISVRSSFWTFLGARCFPNLRQAAVRLLAMHVTTAAAERNWSSWGNTYNAGRSQLNVATAEKMVFIKANIPSSEPRAVPPAEGAALQPVGLACQRDQQWELDLLGFMQQVDQLEEAFLQQLQGTQAQLTDTAAALEAAQKDLAAARTELAHTKRQLTTTSIKLEQLRAQVAAANKGFTKDQKDKWNLLLRSRVSLPFLRGMLSNQSTKPATQPACHPATQSSSLARSRNQECDTHTGALATTMGGKRLSKKKRQQLQELPASPKAGLKCCPSGLKAQMNKAHDEAMQLRAHVERLRQQLSDALANYQQEQADMEEVQAAQHELQGENELLEQLAEERTHAIQLLQRDKRRLSLALRNVRRYRPRGPRLTRHQQQLMNIMMLHRVSPEVLQRCVAQQPCPAPDPPALTANFVPTQVRRCGKPAARTAAYLAQHYLSTARQVLQTQASRRKLAMCRELFVNEHCVVPYPHREGQSTTMGRQLLVVAKYLKSKTLEMLKQAKAIHLALDGSTEVRTSLTRFRLGNSGLGVEKARFEGVTFIDRTCTRCTEGVVDDAMHFIFECTATSSIREQPEFAMTFQNSNENLHNFMLSPCAPLFVHLALKCVTESPEPLEGEGGLAVSDGLSGESHIIIALDGCTSAMLRLEEVAAAVARAPARAARKTTTAACSVRGGCGECGGPCKPAAGGSSSSRVQQR